MTKALWNCLRRLDRDIPHMRAMWQASWRPERDRLCSRLSADRMDKKRASIRAEIKKYTGSGVGGSARRGTPRSPGSSPGSPTIIRPPVVFETPCCHKEVHVQFRAAAYSGIKPVRAEWHGVHCPGCALTYTVGYEETA